MIARLAEQSGWEVSICPFTGENHSLIIHVEKIHALAIERDQRDSLALLENLRRAGIHLPVMLLVDERDSTDGERRHDLPVDSMLEKPLNAVEFIEALHGMAN